MIAGLLTRPRVLFTLSTSPTCESSPCWEAIVSNPSFWRVGISLLKHEPSAHSPWTKTILGLVCDFDFIFAPFLILLRLRRSRNDARLSAHVWHGFTTHHFRALSGAPSATHLCTFQQSYEAFLK